MISVTKRFEFSYGHTLKDHKGKCKNLHGHNGILEVEITKSLLPIFKKDYPGMVIDFGDLKKIVKEEIIDILDHSYLNEALQTDYPTAEYVCLWVWRKLFKTFQYSLKRVRIYETSDSYAEIITSENKEIISSKKMLLSFLGKYDEKGEEM